MRFICVSALVLGLSSRLFAQTPGGGGQVEIDDLRTPASPAFVLLDVTPAAVERPESPKALVVNALTAASRASGGFPRDYALQVTPYWLQHHPDLTFDKYQHPTVLDSIIRTFSVSVATSPLLSSGTADITTVGTRVGLGGRTTIVGGQPNPQLGTKLKALEAVNLKMLDNPNDLSLREEARELALEIQSLPRSGLFVTAATALTWSVPEDRVEQSRADRFGLWVTPSYRFTVCPDPEAACKNIVDVVGVLRTIREIGFGTAWDVGARVLWQPTDPFTISVETVRRSGAGSLPGSRRSAGMLEYRIREDVLLFGSFGKDFERRETTRTLVSILGLSFGFGRKPSVPVM